jgi:hypothetical protein
MRGSESGGDDGACACACAGLCLCSSLLHLLILSLDPYPYRDACLGLVLSLYPDAAHYLCRDLSAHADVRPWRGGYPCACLRAGCCCSLRIFVLNLKVLKLQR